MTLVIGGGPAGAATAALLARNGHAVTLLEREAAPRHKICGEFLSGEAQRYLRALGVDLTPAVAIDRVRLIAGRRTLTARLPFTGLSLTRRHLDEALLQAAARAGAAIHRGWEVRRLAPEGVVLADTTLAAQRIVLASGKHEIRGARRRLMTPPEDLVGLKTYFALAPTAQAALANTVEVMLFRDGYAGLQPVEGGFANLCLLVGRDRLSAGFAVLLDALKAECPHLAARLTGATAALPRPLSIFRVPYGHLHAPAPDDPPSLFRIGDQMAVIPSFTGDGMAMALHGGFVAARTILAGAPAAACHARLHHDCGPPIRRASALYRLARLPLGIPLLHAACAVPGVLRQLAKVTRLSDSCLASRRR